MAALQLQQLAKFALDNGRLEDALTMLKEALRIWSGLNRPGGIAETLCGFAEILTAEGRTVSATQLLSRAELLREDIGGVPSWVVELNERTLAAIRTQLDERALVEAWEQGRAMSLDETVALALGV